MGRPDVSVIVRAKDAEETLTRTLQALREQTVAAEIIVVDSGSCDRTVEIARRHADRLLEIRSADFTYGRALNLGAAAARAPVHAALSSHCLPAGHRWLERSLAHYGREDVAATNGMQALPDGSVPIGPFHQDLSHALADVRWGQSNHAATWRAAVWESFPFDEALPACEDREWALRVLGAGWRIAFDRELWVDMSHRSAHGYRAYFRRRRREMDGFARFSPLRDYRWPDAVHDWWTDDPTDHRPPWRRRISVMRAAGIAGDVAGAADARTVLPAAGSPTPPRSPRPPA